MTEESFTPALAAKWSHNAAKANAVVQRARILLITGRTEENGQSVSRILFDAQTLTQRLATSMHRAAGVYVLPLQNEFPGIPLELLSTPDTRELLRLLEAAQEVAERVDKSRGCALPDVIPLQLGESRGTDLAEIISEIALRVRIEVRGPNGRGEARTA